MSFRNAFYALGLSADGEGLLGSYLNKRLPAFAVPVMIIIQKKPVEMNAAGKIVKEPLRAQAKQLWSRQSSSNGTRQSKL